MSEEKQSIRTLFCFGVLPAFFETDKATRKHVFDVLVEAYSNLATRFGIQILGTLDDDRMVVGPTLGWPWTCYMMADVPDHEAVIKFCNILREFDVGEVRLWKYIKVEARTGRELFFGQS